jgi:outer membrane biosynthesis protein TonB
VPGLEHDSLAAEAPSEQSEAAGVTEPKEAASPIRATPDTARSEPVTTAPGAGGAATTPTPDTNSLEMPFARDPTYYAVAALDTPPSLLGPADACYPQGAIGEVAYVLLIDEHGAVDQVSVAAVQPSGLFTGAAVELCGQLKFAPGIRNGRPVRSRVRFVVGPTLQ